MEWLLAASALLMVAVILGLAYRPLGDYMACVFTSRRHWRLERLCYRVAGIAPERQQSWRAYLTSVIVFSAVGFVLLYAMLRLQPLLPYSLGMPGMSPDLAFNTAVSFVGNTNWQSYSPEQSVGYAVQMGGLAVQNFVSAAVSMAVAVALIRGFASRRARSGLGNFWVDLVRANLRILLPLCVVAAIVLLAGGVIQNFAGFTGITTVAGGTQALPGGPVASEEAIKLLGTNGGGFFNANSAHPFENPTPWTNLFEVFLMLVIPFALPRTFGTMVGDRRQGYAILAAMGVLFVASTVTFTALELGAGGTAPQLAGAAMEGKEQRFGIVGTTIFGSATTLTSTGAVDGMHDSLTPLGGMMTMINMMLGEIAPGGVGSGLYGMLVIAVIAVFLAGLLVGRTPEYLGKKIGPLQMKLASLYILVTPTLVLTGAALSFAVPGVRDSVTKTSILNPGPHGVSEVLYAFTSAANNNGSAFAGLGADTPWLNAALGAVMLLGRFVPIVLVLALAGSLAVQDAVPVTAGTLPTHRPLFVAPLVGTAVLVTALIYFPFLALGPLAEGLV